MIPFDMFEEILKRCDVEDLIRCKSVCKSWQSFISHPCFVKAHLKHSYNNDLCNPDFLHRRVRNLIPAQPGPRQPLYGSCNGLVCASTDVYDDQFLVFNPCTRVVKKTTPFALLDNCERVCDGFGYDSSADDYKLIAGFTSEGKHHILFYALTLKSNVWKLFAQVKYYMCSVLSPTGILHGGALHWFMYDANKRLQIISLDLSTQEFKEIPQPTHKDYQPPHMTHRFCYYEEHYEGKHGCCLYELGVVEECLSINVYCSKGSRTCVWVMKKNNKWESHGDYFSSKKDVSHRILESEGYTLASKRLKYLEIKTSLAMDFSIFVKSLVSPHPRVNNNDNYYEGQTMGIANMGKRNEKRRKRSCECIAETRTGLFTSRNDQAIMTRGRNGWNMRMAECLLVDENGIVFFTARNNQGKVSKFHLNKRTSNPMVTGPGIPSPQAKRFQQSKRLLQVSREVVHKPARRRDCLVTTECY